ncbi:sodium/hydrogen exchanger family protein, partial [Vibrio parahaemolyticus V-223/04]
DAKTGLVHGARNFLSWSVAGRK